MTRAKEAAGDRPEVIIGLETHVQLNSKSKLLCGCANPATLEEQEPNTLTCPTCLGLPGSKPRVNEAVLGQAMKVALALGCTIAKETFFSRKTYFYPDMSKNFQVTQYEVPLAVQGSLAVEGRPIRIRRIHIEEDPARLVHAGGLGGGTLVDYNRAGTPLIEIVTEPDFRSPREARLYLQKLALVLEYLGVYAPDSRAVIKSDANISLRGGDRIEVKNITGTKEIEQALQYEILRQSSLVRRGERVVQATRAWNPDRGTTQELRAKEAEAEYGYIFEPDLTPIEIGEEVCDRVRKELPELPEQRFARYVQDYDLPSAVAEAVVSDRELAGLFEEVAKKVDPRLAGSWIAGYLKKTLNYNEVSLSASGITAASMVSLLKLFKDGMITDKNAELTIRKMVEEKLPAETVVKKYRYQVRRFDLDLIAKKVVDANPAAVQDYRNGQEKALNFLVGLVIKETSGGASAQDVRKVLLDYVG